MTSARPGTPLTSSSLADLGISSDLAVHYGKSGWLQRVAQGVYILPNAPLDLHASLAVLREKVPGLHVGGRSALDWHGMRQYVSARPVLELYGWETAKLPEWFTGRFPSRYKRKRIFNEDSSEPLQVAPFERTQAWVSSPERAVLEMLSDVGVGQPLQEAKEILETTAQLRARKLQELLARCTSVKTVRLCLQLGRGLNLPWAAKLHEEGLPTGSRSPWIARTREGLLVLK